MSGIFEFAKREGSPGQPDQSDVFVAAAQKPSRARPTQLNANRPQAAAATEASVAIVFLTGMTATFSKRRSHSVQRRLLNDGEKTPVPKNQALWRCCNMNLVLPGKIRNRTA